jgi:hypothetical protein
MRRLNHNRVKTNQIGQYTLKINSIIFKLQKSSLSGEQNVAAGKKIKIIQIINLSASEQNRYSENCDASKNRLFFPPLQFISCNKDLWLQDYKVKPGLLSLTKIHHESLISCWLG